MFTREAIRDNILTAGLDIGDRMVANGDCEFGFGDCEKKSVAKLATVKLSYFFCYTVFFLFWWNVTKRLKDGRNMLFDPCMTFQFCIINNMNLAFHISTRQLAMASEKISFRKYDLKATKWRVWNLSGNILASTK